MALTTRKPWLFSDKSKRIISSDERIKLLIDAGFLFEACVVQASVIEALLYFSISSEALYRTPSEREDILKGLNELTFGGLISRSQRSLAVDKCILAKLGKYKDNRNFLIHHHLIENEDFDYKSFLKEGENLILYLLDSVRKKLHKALKSMGLKDANQLE